MGGNFGQNLQYRPKMPPINVFPASAERPLKGYYWNAFVWKLSYKKELLLWRLRMRTVFAVLLLERGQ